jgi:NADH-quinone oxidoreductase subunit G
MLARGSCRKTESIDVMDAVGSATSASTPVAAKSCAFCRASTRRSTRNGSPTRSRFVWDGLRTQRLDQPYEAQAESSSPRAGTRPFAAVAARLKKAGSKVGAIAGDLAGVEEMYRAQVAAGFARLTNDRRAGRMSGSSIPALGRAQPTCSTHHRGHRAGRRHPDRRRQPAQVEAALLNARIRKTLAPGWNIPIGVIGEHADLTYAYDYLGDRQPTR